MSEAPRSGPRAVAGLDIPHANAICYSGYREGQDPNLGIFPSHDEIREDLRILAKHWTYLRVYDSGQHARTVLEVIRDEGFEFKVMLGMGNAAEVNNPNCPWGVDHDEATLAANRRLNDAEIDATLELAKGYSDIVFSVSVGNEALVGWTDHLVPIERLVDRVRRLRSEIHQPITFCENYLPWTQGLDPLASELDFLSVHTYPVWEYQSIDAALDFTRQNVASVTGRHPDKPVVITEAGWTTASNGRGIEPENASEELQARYYAELMEWTNRERILTFVFEAFDEPWKGSPDAMEPEKHWGLFRVDRRPKLVMRDLFGE